MSIEKEEIDRNARRYGVEDDPKVRRQRAELDTVERDAIARMPKGPAAFYAAAPPTASFPDIYTPPAARFAQDVDRSVARQDMAAAGVPNIDDESTWPSQWGKQPALPPAARRSGVVMNLDEPVKGSVPTASFPRDDPWGALGPRGQQDAYRMMGYGNEEITPEPSPGGQPMAWEALSPGQQSQAYQMMGYGNEANLPQEGSAAGAYAGGSGGGNEPPVYEPPIPAWATRREASAMQQAQPGVQQQRSPFDAFHLNEGIQVYADAVRGARQ